MPSQDQHIIISGEIVSSLLPTLYHNNLSFLNGDGLHEYMHAYGTEIQFVDSHFERLYKGMQILGITIDDKLSQHKIVREITRLLNRDKIFGNAEVKLTVFRTNSFESGYVVSCEQLESNLFNLSTKGLSLGIFKSIVKQFNPLSALSTNNNLLNVMADNYAMTENFDDVLLINYKGNIIESSHSNVFIVNGNKIYTPSVSEGCVAGVMRLQVLNAARTENFEIFDNCVITEKNILEADEVFLTNAVDGIKWVMAFGQRRYYNKVAKILCDRINKIAFEK